MAKRRKLNQSSDFAGFDEPGKTFDPVTSLTDSKSGFQKRPHSPDESRNRSQSHGMTDALRQSDHGADGTNILSLQLHELLEKTRRTAQCRMSKAQNALQQLRQIIEQIPPRDGMSISSAEEALRQNDDVSIPFPEPRPDKDAKYTVTYDKPEDISIVQDYTRDIDIGVEVAVTMPSQIFHEKDFLNYRYFYKRAYYLACLAAGIKKNKGSYFSLNFALQNDNPLQPILLFGPQDDGEKCNSSKENWHIRIILVAPDCLFPLAKTLPAKCCIRIPNTNAVETHRRPTPFYNSTIRSECSTVAYQRLLNYTSTQSEAYQDACILGGVWLRRRGLQTDLAAGGFGQFEWACMMALLLRKDDSGKKPLFSKGYNSYQLFKATLHFIAASDLCLEPLIMGCESLELVDQKGPVFVDGAQGFNILFKMTDWSYRLLQHEAKGTIQTSKDPLVDKFRCTFITKIDNPFHRFDYCFRLARIPSGDSHEGSAGYFNEATRFYQKTYDALRRGLGDRAKLIYLQCCQTTSWGLGSSECPPSRNIDLLVGLILNPEKCWRSLDHGPPAENLAASQEFRKFWGDKAELRRFKDGSILECVVWNPRDPKQSILDQIIIYVLRPHTPVILGSAFNQLVPRPNSDASNPTTPFLPIITTFESLAKKIRSLERLPLQIRQITAACPELCFASLGIPNLDPTVNNTKPVDVIIQFEGSARWPGGIVAVQRTKIAFLLKLGELLEEGTPGLTTKLGLENENNELLNQSFLDVFDPIGAVFRLRIHHERELSILQQEMKHESSTFRRLNIGSAISTYKRDFIERPRHTEMVRILSTRFPLLSPTIRLMKKWRDSHLLSGHIGDELVELLTIRTFVHPHPWPIPGSITTGFLRTLAWLASWDWRVEPLIIDFHHEMSGQDIADVNLKYKAWRKIDPGMNRIATFVASNLDRDGVTWTEQGPSKVATARLFSLAVSADGLAKKQGLSLRAEALFATPRADYDFVIHLNPDYVHGSSAQSRRRQSFKNLTLQRDSMISPGDTPVQAFLAEVRKMYGSNILFFHNAHETLFIAGIWNPQTGIRNWKGNLGYSSMPVFDSGSDAIKIAINSMATLHDLATLGGSLVSKIDLK